MTKKAYERIIVALIIIFAIYLTLNLFRVHADDNENDLGLCINYHIQVACDRVDIKKYTDQLLGKAQEWNNRSSGCDLMDSFCSPDIPDLDPPRNHTDCDFSNNSCPDIIAPQIQKQAYSFSQSKPYNQSEDKDVFPFPVPQSGLTFCYQVPKKEFGVRGSYIECNWVEMDKKHLKKVRDYLETYANSSK